MPDCPLEPTPTEYMGDAIGNAWASGLDIDDLVEALIFDNRILSAAEFNTAIWAAARLASIAGE